MIYFSDNDQIQIKTIDSAERPNLDVHVKSYPNTFSPLPQVTAACPMDVLR